MTFLFFSLIFLLIDYYVFQGVLVVTGKLSQPWKDSVRIGFWVPTAIAILALCWWAFGDPYRYSAASRSWVITGLVATYFSKTFAIVVLFVDDLGRGVRWLVRLFTKDDATGLPGEAITRSDFLSKTALIAASVPFGAMAYGIISEGGQTIF